MLESELISERKYLIQCPCAQLVHNWVYLGAGTRQGEVASGPAPMSGSHLPTDFMDCRNHRRDGFRWGELGNAVTEVEYMT